MAGMRDGNPGNHLTVEREKKEIPTLLTANLGASKV